MTRARFDAIDDIVSPLERVGSSRRQLGEVLERLPPPFHSGTQARRGHGSLVLIDFPSVTIEDEVRAEPPPCLPELILRPAQTPGVSSHVCIRRENLMHVTSTSWF